MKHSGTLTDIFEGTRGHPDKNRVPTEALLLKQVTINQGVGHDVSAKKAYNNHGSVLGSTPTPTPANPVNTSQDQKTSCNLAWFRNYLRPAATRSWLPPWMCVHDLFCLPDHKPRCKYSCQDHNQHHDHHD